ncbi:MAG: prenyltransferase/squalene oxidase repeat-containing protein [Planctomycetota bacterium]
MADTTNIDQTDDVNDAANLSTGHALLDDPLLTRLTSQAPWWLVSVVFHILIMVLAYMCTIAIVDSDSDGGLIPVVTNPHINFPDKNTDIKTPKADQFTDAMKLSKDIAPTDPNSPETSKIEIPPEILARAELSDRFTTLNMDRPDTNDAFGNPASTSFRTATGNAGDVGGNSNASTHQLEDMINSGMDRNRAISGRWGSNKGSGNGTDPGNGIATWGGRNGGSHAWRIKRYKGSQATENSVEAALRWLAYHQESDGHWDAKKYASSEKTDTAVTGFALLAFLGAGNSEKVGEYKDNVKRAVAWMKSKQAANGLPFDTTDAGGHRGEGYPGAIATMALAEAAGMANIDDTRKAAQRAVNYCTEIHQAGEGSDKLGWRYHPKMEGDTSVAGWFMMALKSAKVARLNVNHASFDGAIKFLDSVEHKGTGGDPGYVPPSTYWYTTQAAHEPHRLSAIGCLCRQYLGWKKDDLQASVEAFVAKGGVPSWGGNGGSVDLYYWYYGTLCTFQQGGDVWTKWNDAMKTALVPNQRKDGDDHGSWDPVGAYANEWGRVGQTALGALCLEVYYRNERLYGDAR